MNVYCPGWIGTPDDGPEICPKHVEVDEIY